MGKIIYVDKNDEKAVNQAKLIHEEFSDVVFIDNLDKITNNIEVIYIIGNDSVVNEVINKTSNPISVLSKNGKNHGEGTIDVGLVNNIKFLNRFEIGFLSGQNKGIFINMIDFYRNMESFDMLSNLYGKIRISNFVLFAICNGSFNGKTIYGNDGNFELYNIANNGRYQILKALKKLFSKNYVSPIQIQKFDADFLGNINTFIDGREIMLNKFHFSVIKEGVTIIKDGSFDKVLSKVKDY